MKKQYILWFKEWKDSNEKHFKRFDSLEKAEKAAGQMIELFNYWKDGANPISIAVEYGRHYETIKEF